ncbi:MAG: TonB-dependent receptor plug domain-containing protein, partial [Alistipes sp.]|nr:TonB-dependent receptor plug domain-containing protein [Alistipes sp.]
MKKFYLPADRGSRLSTRCFRLLLLVPMLLFSPNGQAAANMQDTRVSVDARDVAVLAVLNQIEQQTDFSFVYNSSDIDTGRKVNFTASGEPLTDVLGKLFAGSTVDYTLRDKHIVLSKKVETATTQPVVSGVSGTVVGEQGEPLVGAAVVIAGTITGVTVDGNGNFTIPQAKPGDVLEVSLLGYTKQTVTVTGPGPITIVMSEDNQVIDTVVVTALGIRREEKALTYNVQEVGGDVVNSVKDANFMNALSGKVAGLQINASSSGAGGSTRVVMRGVKSINGNNNALYVVDGIPLPELRSKQSESFFESPDGGDYEGIANLNPEDIESMSILSGATAAALYGSQGANGVILITTKKGSEGRLRVSYSNSTPFSSPFVMPKFQHSYGPDPNSPSMSGGEK